MEKKHHERSILRLIYDEAVFDAVDESERPDFVLRRSPSADPFGVEVTEFYYSEADARLANIPDYLTELLEGNPPRHKDDITELRVDEITIIGPDDTVKTRTNAIFRPLPPPADHVRDISEAITTKDAGVREYQPGLSHVNLIVNDRAKRFYTLPSERFSALVLNPEMKRCLITTSYREVYFITHMDSGKHVFIPLRMLLLLSELYLFNAVLNNHPGPRFADITRTQELELFGAFMKLRGAHALMLRAEGGETEIILGNSGVTIINEQVIARDYRDYPIQGRAEEPKPGLSLDEEFLEFCEEFDAENVFVSDLTFDVRPQTP